MSKIMELSFRGGTYIVHWYSDNPVFPQPFVGIKKIKQINGMYDHSKELKDVLLFYNRSEDYAGLNLKDFLRLMGY
jgi:hypothetical protein